MSNSYPEALKNLIASFSRLPGIGPKTAQRLSFFLIKSSPEEIEGLINSLTEVKEKIHFCSRCGFYAEDELCSICQDSNRESTILCVVERPQDVHSIEKTGYRGLYHVCLLYTSDAADDLLCVDLGGRRIIKKKKTNY